MTLRALAVVLASLALSTLVAPLPLAAQSAPPCVGAWTYESGWTGYGVGVPGHFAWIRTAPGSSEGERAFTAAVARAHCDESRGQVEYLVAADPAAIGRRLEYDQEVDGDEIRFWILRADGSRGAAQMSRKLGTRPYASGDACADLDGVWELEDDEWEGMFVHHQGYAVGVYTRIGRPASAVSNDDVRAFAHRFTCTGNRLDMEMLANSDRAAEGSRLSAEFEVSGDIVTWWILDEDGRRGPSQRARLVRD